MNRAVSGKMAPPCMLALAITVSYATIAIKNDMAYIFYFFLSAITLRSIIDEHMCSIAEQDRSLVKPFSLYVLKGVLDAVSTLHQKGWAHHDLHGTFNDFNHCDYIKIEPCHEETCLQGFVTR